MARRNDDLAGVDTYGLHAGPVPVPFGKPPRIAIDWIHTTHPDTGLRVVFKAGEALPDWMSDPTAEH